MKGISIFGMMASLLLVGENVYCQGTPGKNSAYTSIREIFKQVNGYKGYKVVTIDEAEDFLGHATDNGASLAGYYKGDSLKKIVEWIGLSNRVVVREYYFQDDKLMFVYGTDRRCKMNDSTGEVDCSKFEKAIEERFYFQNEKLLTGDKESETNKTKLEEAKEIADQSKQYAGLLGEKKGK